MKVSSLPVRLWIAAVSLTSLVLSAFANSADYEESSSSVPIVYVQVANPLASEPGDNPGTFTIFRTGDTNAAVTVPIVITGTASNGVDYAAIPKSVTFAAAQLSTNIVVAPVDKPSATGYKTVVLSIPREHTSRGSSPDYYVGAVNRAIVYVVYNYTNAAPTISLLSPTNGASYFSMPNIELTVSAKDSNGWINSVEFFANGASIGTVLNEADDWYSEPIVIRKSHGAAHPILTRWAETRFQFVWTNVPPGAYSLTALATDNAGLQTTSTATQITVTTNLPEPVVRIVNPYSGAKFADQAPINIVAAATETNGIVDTVQFVANATNILGTATNYLATEPYSRGWFHSKWVPFYFQWTNAPVGSNTLTAIVTDNNGTMVTSAPVTINVTTNSYRHHRW